MVGVKSFFVVLLLGGVASQYVDDMNGEQLPTLEEYIQANRNKREVRTTRAFTMPPYIGRFYRYNSAVLNRSAVNCHVLQVGIHALVTSKGIEYRRHEFVELDCLNVGSINLRKKNFFQCADAAAASRYNSFTFSSGACKAYSIWRHSKLTTCSHSSLVTGNIAILYIATTALTSYSKTALNRFPISNISGLHGVGRIVARWTSPDRCSLIANYMILTVSGHDILRGGLGTYSYTTFNQSFCNDSAIVINSTINVAAISYEGDLLTVFKINPKTIGSKRYPLSDGSCVMYDPSVALDVTSSITYCAAFYATLPTNSLAMPFSKYKQMIAKVSEPVEDHFTGAMLTSNLTWQWSELCTPVDPLEWDLKESPDNFTLGTCSTSSSSDGYVLLQEDCDATQSVVCHDAAYMVMDSDSTGLT